MSEMKIVVDDGKKRVPIENLHGEEVGCFYFSPTDIGIAERFNEISAKFDEVIEPLEKAGIKPNGEGADTESIQLLAEAKRRLFDLVDYLFGGNYSEAFFGTINPFSPVGGNFYCVVTLNAVMKFIEAELNTASKKINKNLAKYTKRYSK